MRPKGKRAATQRNAAAGVLSQIPVSKLPAVLAHTQTSQTSEMVIGWLGRFRVVSSAADHAPTDTLTR